MPYLGAEIQAKRYRVSDFKNRVLIYISWYLLVGNDIISNKLGLNWAKLRSNSDLASLRLISVGVGLTVIIG